MHVSGAGFTRGGHEGASGDVHDEVGAGEAGLSVVGCQAGYEDGLDAGMSSAHAERRGPVTRRAARLPPRAPMQQGQTVQPDGADAGAAMDAAMSAQADGGGYVVGSTLNADAAVAGGMSEVLVSGYHAAQPPEVSSQPNPQPQHLHQQHDQSEAPAVHTRSSSGPAHAVAGAGASSVPCPWGSSPHPATRRQVAAQAAAQAAAGAHMCTGMGHTGQQGRSAPPTGHRGTGQHGKRRRSDMEQGRHDADGACGAEGAGGVGIDAQMSSPHPAAGVQQGAATRRRGLGSAAAVAASRDATTPMHAGGPGPLQDHIEPAPACSTHDHDGHHDPLNGASASVGHVAPADSGGGLGLAVGMGEHTPHASVAAAHQGLALGPGPGDGVGAGQDAAMFQVGQHVEVEQEASMGRPASSTRAQLHVAAGMEAEGGEAHALLREDTASDVGNYTVERAGPGRGGRGARYVAGQHRGAVARQRGSGMGAGEGAEGSGQQVSGLGRQGQRMTTASAHGAPAYTPAMHETLSVGPAVAAAMPASSMSCGGGSSEEIGGPRALTPDLPAGASTEVRGGRAAARGAAGQRSRHHPRHAAVEQAATGATHAGEGHCRVGGRGGHHGVQQRGPAQDQEPPQQHPPQQQHQQHGHQHQHQHSSIGQYAGGAAGGVVRPSESATASDASWGMWGNSLQALQEWVRNPR